MAEILIAPNPTLPSLPSVFLAGGISNCKDWQKEVIDELKNDNISIFSPRQENFDITDKLASNHQIEWEFERLEQMDIFSMYFCNDNSVQPICMYELGRNIVRMQNRFPFNWQDRIVVSIEKGYAREKDVIMQLKLCAPELFIDAHATPLVHSARIRQAFKKLELV